LNSELAILVPVLGRPHRVKPLLDSIEASTPGARVVFICDPDDTDEVNAIREARGGYSFIPEILITAGGYAKKINRGVARTSEPLLFLGADDLEFRPGWFEAARIKVKHGAHVVGVNDLINRRRIHATHFLMTRDYAERETIDGGRGPLHEGYHHWFVDDELIATAKKRGVYAYAQRAHVEHLHPMMGAEDDEVYELGRSNARADRATHRKRQRLWS
jgi:glycosyltransferase involved in cell wall biosynthesis